MKIIFAGTPAFAAHALQALLTTSHEIVAVFTQQDRPAGRGLKLTPSPVKILALEQGVAVYQPASLKDPAVQQTLTDFAADVMVVAAYGMLLPKAVLSIPRFGCINIHPSLLPRWRGAAPIPRTILAGDQQTGVTIMQMDEGLDTGPMLWQQTIAVEGDDTAQTLHDKLAVLGARALIVTLEKLAQDELMPIIQDNAKSTYANKINKEEALLNWQDAAMTLEYKVRAFNPRPVAFTLWQDKPLRIWSAKAVVKTIHAAPGTLLAASKNGIEIATGFGALNLLQLQLPGGKPLSAADFYNARQADLTVGKLFA